jgi:oligoendopeptidase F
MSEMPIDVYKGVNDKQEQYKQSVKNAISDAESRLSTLDKKTQKAEIAGIKALITEKKKELRAIEKELRANKKIDINNISNIEEVINAEAKERMMALMNIYQAMKEAAVDCRIMREFHKSTCADFAAV